MFVNMPNMETISVWPCSTFSSSSSSSSSFEACASQTKIVELCQQPSPNSPMKIPFSDALRSPGDIVYLFHQATKQNTFTEARGIHLLMASCGLESVPFLCDHLIRLFSLCENLADANKVFYKILVPSVFTWDAIISAHVRCGECMRAFKLYHEMLANSISPDNMLYLTIIKACIAIQNIYQGRKIHGQIIIHGLEADVYLGSSVIDMYAKCMCLEDARTVFDKLDNVNVVSWNALISGYVSAGFFQLAIELFEKMQTEGFRPDCLIFPGILKACGRMQNLQLGKHFHNKIRESGFEMDMAVNNSLIDMYSKCATFHEAHKVFDNMHTQNAISWTTLIVGYVEHGHSALALQVNHQMLLKGVVPQRATYLAILKVCGSVDDIELGRTMHRQILQAGLDIDIAIANTLIATYAKCAIFDDASYLFEKVCPRNIVSWSTMISGYIQHGHHAYALHLFMRMQEEGVKADALVLACLLKACGYIKAVQQGMLIHDQVLRSNLQSDVVVGNSLITMYANCGIVTEAHTVFANLLNRNIISWGAILATLVEEGDSTHALVLIDKLQEENLTFDQAIWLTAVQACGTIGSIKKLHLFHEQMKGTIFKNDLVIGNALIDVYSRLGAHSEALKVFNDLPSRDEISWGTIINCQAQRGESHVVIDLFLRMLEDKITPNDVIFSCFLKACGDIRILQEAHLVHDFLIKSRLKATNAMLNSLINMYVNCMSLIEARAVFEGMQSKDEISWSVFIAGHAMAGNWSMIVHCLDEMQQQGLSPTTVLFVTILGACSKGGYLEEGCKFFMMMTRYFSFTPNIEHYNCMIDLLARSGHLVDAIDLIETMPISVDLLGWTSLLTNCDVYGNVEIGRICSEQVMQLDPNNVLAFDVMTNIYMDAGLWEDINRKDEMKTSIVKSSKDFGAVGIP